jgi:hypothetical protein
MGRNPFAQKAGKAAAPAPTPPEAVQETLKAEAPKKPAKPVAKAAREETVETTSHTNGVLRNAVLHAAVKLPADLFVLAVKTHALIESFLDR